jgi:hypothetical protein
MIAVSKAIMNCSTEDGQTQNCAIISQCHASTSTIISDACCSQDFRQREPRVRNLYPQKSSGYLSVP